MYSLKSVLGWGTSLVVQWLRLFTSTAGGVGLIPGQRNKIPHAMEHGHKIKKKKKKKEIMPLAAT